MIMPGAADAADDEGRCLKAEVEILRSHARQNVKALAQLVPQTNTSPLRQEGAKGSDSLQTHRPDQRLATQQQQWQWQDQQQLQQDQQQQQQQQRQKQQQQQQQHQHQHQQQQQPQGSGSASEMELAAVEQGLSALDKQITAAALR